MKKLFALVLLASAACFAQTFTSVSATGLTDHNGAVITSGTVSFSADREFGLSGSQQACCQQAVPRTALVTSGAFTLNVPNEATIVKPNSVCWSMVITDTSGKIVLGPDGYRCVKPTGGSYVIGTDYIAGNAPVPVSPVELLPYDCGSGQAVQKINPDGTVKCGTAGGGGGGAVDSVFGLTGAVGNLTGDVTSSGVATTLATSGVSAGTTGDATHTNAMTVDAKGRVTAVTSTAIAIPESAVTSLVSDLALKAPLASPAFTGTAAFSILELCATNCFSEINGNNLVNAAGVKKFDVSGNFSIETLTGTGSKLLSGTGSYTNGHGLVIDASGNAIDSGSAPGGGFAGFAQLTAVGTGANTTETALCTIPFTSGQITSGNAVKITIQGFAGAGGSDAISLYWKDNTTLDAGITGIPISGLVPASRSFTFEILVGMRNSTTAVMQAGYVDGANNGLTFPRAASAKLNTVSLSNTMNFILSGTNGTVTSNDIEIDMCTAKPINF